MRLTSLVLATLLALVGCAAESATAAPGRYDRGQLLRAFAEKRVDPGLVIGEFPLANAPVVDGDTVKVAGLDASLRLLGLDAEETFKNERDLRAYEAGFADYVRKKRGKSTRPVKYATPLGMEAKKFADEFFADVTVVRLERDHPKEIRDRYDRYLAYVFAKKGGRWVNYNVECVRAGMSPYFTKYGNSRRFHEQLIAAQDEARRTGRGIWAPGAEHYGDYEERLRWWNARGDFVEKFDRESRTRPNYVNLTHWDALDQLAALEGEEVVLLATVGNIYRRKGNAPARVMLGRRLFDDFPLVFWDDDVLEQSGVLEASGEFVRVRGTVTRYVHRARRKGKAPREQLQIEIKLPQQLALSHLPAPARAPEPATTPAEQEPAEPAVATEPTPSDSPTPPDAPPPPEPSEPVPAEAAPPAADQNSPKE